MRAFAELLDRLSLTASRNAKLTLLRDYLRVTPDPDRGWALAALTGDLSFDAAKPAMIRAAVERRVDPLLFRWSHDYVGDLAETVALIWPADPTRRANREPQLAEIVETLKTAGRADVPGLIERWMDDLAPKGRWALLKLMTGALRVGMSGRLAKTAAARVAPDGDPRGVDASDVEELWQGLEAPYADLFAWLEGRAERPAADAPGRFRPVMLSVALDEAVDLARVSPEHWIAEWKWDGIRVQAVREADVARLWSRTGDEISRAFPDLMAALDFDAAVDGELVVLRNGAVAPFGDLQQRLNRKTVDPKLVASHPAALIAYDLLAEAGEDLRPLPLVARRERLARLVERVGSERMILSPDVPFADVAQLAALRGDPPVGAAAEGLMLKRRDSAYVAGRPKGPWFKWKRDPHVVDAVLMYAQRGHGKRSSFYSDFTFGVWTEEGTLTPVGKAYFGFTDEELKQLDKFVRDHTLERFGPVRSVKATREFGLVLEIAFEGLQRSTRHKSGVAMRFPRVSRIRWDKPVAEADTLGAVLALLEALERDGGRLATSR
ncbi:MAG: cisplatin damage response ATP-dependent DNA ligase [Alphaproteobacteria bacterium]|nr:cisplatin damage response ATP-dependent DNA ligase [Alphaproteobacteria bacterium]MBU1526004.1 cisplatin damage response ATP-dependent DNA ligase [Alphaproteobacteria bacterium]MBU2116353.1 cisplatin damage response ATP-dependent DNA ligase [Alphaproteobacteria bacterium]MBU2350412.1 cisplatin damage response ATP-dependent DNA ligase [Alphaproteobacteria bacterium]MBU2383254.1 cisplatin damage response ATP-dependent DNA ligase [Alphaproteobacteria bacterium]